MQCAHSGARVCVLEEVVDKQVVFSSIDPVRGRLEELARVENRNYARGTDLSPDGSKVALVENGGDSVRLLDLKTKQIQVIHPDPPQTGLQLSSWSADGKRLFVAGFPNRKGRLLEMGLAGHTRILLENPHGWIGAPLASPDGKRLAYTYAVTESNVTLLENF